LLPGLGGEQPLENPDVVPLSSEETGSKRDQQQLQPPEVCSQEETFSSAGPSLKSDRSKPVKLWQCPTNKLDWDDIKLQAKNLAEMGWRYKYT